jgi:ATP-dependent DNA helicase RecQ
VNETLMLYQQGKSINEIIKQRELTATTVYTHLSAAIEMGLLDVKEVLELDEQKYDEIVFAIESFGDDEERRLKPVFEALDGVYDYGMLRCVQASI